MKRRRRRALRRWFVERAENAAREPCPRCGGKVELLAGTLVVMDWDEALAYHGSACSQCGVHRLVVLGHPAFQLWTEEKLREAQASGQMPPELGEDT